MSCWLIALQALPSTPAMQLFSCHVVYNQRNYCWTNMGNSAIIQSMPLLNFIAAPRTVFCSTTLRDKTSRGVPRDLIAAKLHEQVRNPCDVAASNRYKVAMKSHRVNTCDFWLNYDLSVSKFVSDWCDKNRMCKLAFRKRWIRKW